MELPFKARECYPQESLALKKKKKRTLVQDAGVVLWYRSQMSR